MNGRDFSGYVLAGGKSSRMKTDKTLLKIAGRTFIERAVNVLESACGHPARVVLNSKQKNLFKSFSADFDRVFDVLENRGALGGIHAALRDCPGEFAIVLAVDLPFIDAKVIEKIMKTAVFENNYSAVVPRQADGRLQPLCAVYRPAKCLPRIEKLLSENNSLPVRAFLETIPVKIIEEEFLSGNRNVFANINTPADYEKLTTRE